MLLCLSETYLDSSIPDSLLEIDGYSLIRLDHPNDMKIIVKFDSFLRSFERLSSNIKKSKPFLFVITVDFTTRSLYWWSEDINTSEGLKLLSLTSTNGVSQLINEATYFQTSNSSCTDLIFTDQPNLSVNSGVHASLYPNFHYHIVHSSFNLNISYPFPPPPPYQCLVWHYKKADSKNIRKALDSVNWERLFDQLDINAQVAAFNETILNVFRNYVPNKHITIDDKDPVWMNRNIKTKIKEKNTSYQKYIENRRFESDFILLEKLITELNDLIFSTKTV